MNRLIITLFLFPFLVSGQEILNLEDAVSIALKNNYDIQLALSNEAISENSQTIYNSGYLPTITASGNTNYSNNNTSFTSQQGIETSVNGAEVKSYGASLGINYVLYNGGNRKYTYAKLKEQYKLATANKRQQIENTLIQVYTSFFNVARNQEQFNTLKEAYAISKERLERVKAQQEYGQTTSLEVLNARVDANKDSINLLEANVVLGNSKRDLNYLLGREINSVYDVSHTVVLDNSMTYEKLKSQLDSNNIQLLQMALNKSISDMNIKINKSGWVPNLSASASYGANSSDNGKVGFFQTQNSAGLNAGLSLSWNIFDGGTTKVNVQNAKLNRTIQDLNESKLRLEIENQLMSLWAQYTSQQSIRENEELNVTITEQNFLKSKEQFNLGQISALDFRQAQLNLIQTKLNLLNAKYNSKITELELKKFAGVLMN